jgi:tetratricopeptide (TPR) repeat protein
MDQAAYNLCLVLSSDRLEEAIHFCRDACRIRPENPKYAYTLAFYLRTKGDVDEAVTLLKALRQKYPGYKDAALLLREISSQEKIMRDDKSLDK